MSEGKKKAEIYVPSLCRRKKAHSPLTTHLSPFREYFTYKTHPPSGRAVSCTHTTFLRFSFCSPLRSSPSLFPLLSIHPSDVSFNLPQALNRLTFHTGRESNPSIILREPEHRTSNIEPRTLTPRSSSFPHSCCALHFSQPSSITPVPCYTIISSASPSLSIRRHCSARVVHPTHMSS